MFRQRESMRSLQKYDWNVCKTPISLFHVIEYICVKILKNPVNGARVSRDVLTKVLKISSLGRSSRPFW